MLRYKSVITKKMIKAARAGGFVVQKYFGKGLQSVQKSTASDFFTKADIGSERAIISILEKEFPDYNIFSEECGLINKKSSYTFTIDPLDGTNNFVIGIPNFSVAIALQENNITTHSVVYQPFLKQMYCAEINHGAYLGSKKLSVNSVHDINHATVAYSCSYGVAYSREIVVVKQMRGIKIKRFLSCWSPAFDFCLLASGKIEAVVSDHNNKYDYLAGRLIAKEAGALVVDFKGDKLINENVPTFIACNNKIIQRALVNVLS